MELTQKLKQIFISDLEKYSPYMEKDLKKLLMLMVRVWRMLLPFVLSMTMRI